MLENSQSDNEMSRNDDTTGQDLSLVTQLTKRVNGLDEKVSQQLPTLTSFIESCGASVESLEVFKEESLVNSRRITEKLEQLEILCREQGLSAQSIDNIASEIKETTQHIVVDPEIENKLKNLETQLTDQINKLKENTRDPSEMLETIMDEFVSKEDLNEQVSEIKLLISTEQENKQAVNEQNAQLEATFSEKYVSNEALSNEVSKLEASMDESYVAKSSLNEQVEEITASLTGSYVSSDVLDNKVSALQSYMMNRMVSKETLVQNVETLEESLKHKLDAFKESLPEQTNPFEALKPKLDTLFQTLGGLKSVLSQQDEKTEAYKSELLAQIELNSETIKNELAESAQGVEKTLRETELNIKEIAQAIIDQKAEELNAQLESSLSEMSVKLSEKDMALNEVAEAQKVLEERFVVNKSEAENLQNTVTEVQKALEERFIINESEAVNLQNIVTENQEEQKSLLNIQNARVSGLENRLTESEEQQTNLLNNQSIEINNLQTRIDENIENQADLLNKINSETQKQITESEEQQINLLNNQSSEINNLQIRIDESIENQANLLNKINSETQEQIELREKLEFTAEEQLLQQKGLKEGSSKISILLSRIEGLEKELQNSNDNINNDQMIIKSNFEDIGDKSEQLSFMMQDISQELNTHKETITQKSGINEESIVGLQEKMSSIIVEKNNLYSMLEKSKEDFKNQNIKLTQDIESAVKKTEEEYKDAVKKTEEEYKDENIKLSNRISEMQNKSETALQIKSEELNELGKKYSDLQSMRNTLETNISDIKDARDDHQLFSNRLDGWMNMQEKKHKFSSAATVAVLFLIGCFAFFNQQNSEVQTMNNIPENIAIENSDETHLNIEDSEVIVDSADVMDETLNDDIVSEEDTIASTAIDEGLEDTNTAAIELDQTPRVETAFAKTEETSRERKSIEYIVKKNDNLWGIAQRFYKKGHLNKKIIEDNKLGSPHIKPGDVLRIYL